MAKTIEIAKLEEICQCSICLERFDDPRTLHCQHSFCRDCLEKSLISSGPQSLEIFIDAMVGSARLNCPLCRGTTSLKLKSEADPLDLIPGNVHLRQIVELLDRVAPQPNWNKKEKSKDKPSILNAYKKRTGTLLNDNNRTGPSGESNINGADGGATASRDSAQDDLQRHIGSFVSLLNFMHIQEYSDEESDSGDFDDLFDDEFGGPCSMCGSFGHPEYICPWTLDVSSDHEEPEDLFSNRRVSNRQQGAVGNAPSAPKTEGCSRCGRNNHVTRDCRAKVAANGNLGKPRGFMKCYRCGRTNHSHKTCHARYHSNGYQLNGDTRHCVRCGHKSHRVETCVAEYSVDGFRITY